MNIAVHLLQNTVVFCRQKFRKGLFVYNQDNLKKGPLKKWLTGTNESYSLCNCYVLWPHPFCRILKNILREGRLP